MNPYEKQIEALMKAANSNSPALKAAFIAVLEEIRTNLFDTAALEIALAQMNIEGAIAATHIDDMDNLLFGIGMDKNAYIFSQQVQNIWSIGAATAIANLSPEIQKLISFDSIGERAIKLMRNDGANLARDLTQSSREGIRVVIERSLSTGINPAKQARYIRQLVGLTDYQAQAILNFREQLETRQVLGFTPPGDRRLNAVEQAMVNRHMREGTFSDEQIDQMVERYFQSMINKRANDIAHTEALNAINNGQQELWEQGLDQGIFDDNEDRKFWIVTRDDRLRPSHAAIPFMNPNGVKIRSMFITPFGAVNGPGDRNVNLINCRCVAILGWYGQQYTNEGYIQ